MNSNGYDSIPSSSNGNARPSAGWNFSSKLTLFTTIVLFFFAGCLIGNLSTSAPVTPLPPSAESDQWPDYLVSQANLHNKQPTNTHEATLLEWVKSDEPCVPSLGEPWLYHGERSIKSSVTMYFTPEVGDIPGIISGIEVDYYGYIEKNPVGTYFSEESSSKDGTYHSLAVAF